MMSFRDFFRSEKETPNNSAAVARDRLKIIVAHERISRNSHDFLPAMERDIIAVIQKYVQITQEAIDIKLDAQSDVSVLEVNVQLPQ